MMTVKLNEFGIPIVEVSEPTPIDPKLARQKLDCIRAKEQESDAT